MNKLPVIMKPLLKFGGDEACGMGIFLIQTHTPEASNEVSTPLFFPAKSHIDYRAMARTFASLQWLGGQSFGFLNAF